MKLSISSPRKRFTWALLASNDLRRYALNLREAECPEEIVRRIVEAEVNRRFLPRERLLKLRSADFKPWGTPPQDDLSVFDRQRRFRKLLSEKRATLASILGYQVPVEAPEIAIRPDAAKYESAYLELPEEKRQGVRAIQERYWESADELKSRTFARLDPEDREELNRLKVERRAALEDVLTPGELEALDLRTSSLAGLLDTRMGVFEPTAEERRELFRTFRAAEQESQGPNLADGAETRFDAQNSGGAASQLEARERSVLGEARFAELERARSKEFQSLVRIVEKSGLPRDRAFDAHEIKLELERELAGIQEGDGTPEAERRESLERTMAEAERALLEVLGEAGFEKLKQSGLLPSRENAQAREEK